MRMKQQQILNFEMVQISGSEKLYLNDKSLLKCDLNTMGDITHISGRKASLIISSLMDFLKINGKKHVTKTSLQP